MAFIDIFRPKEPSHTSSSNKMVGNFMYGFNNQQPKEQEAFARNLDGQQKQDDPQLKELVFNDNLSRNG